MAFLYFHKYIFYNIFMTKYAQLFFKGLANLFPPVKACHLVKPDVSICSLPGTTLWSPGNLFIITRIQEAAFPDDDSCQEGGRDQDQYGCFKCNILFLAGYFWDNFFPEVKI